MATFRGHSVLRRNQVLVANNPQESPGIAQLSGGTIGLGSAGIPGQGSRFTVTLPAAAAAGG
jgi:hypothetical protein